MREDTKPAPSWSHEDAVRLCRAIEAICPPFGCHVALTGGALYKDGERKDCDILFYRIRQRAKIDEAGLFARLAKVLHIEVVRDCGWVRKAVTGSGRHIDMFFPEYDGSGDYERRSV